MVDLNVKDALSSILLMCTGFGTPFVDDHDDLIGPLGRLFVDMHYGCEIVDGMGGICCVDSYIVDGYFF